MLLDSRPVNGELKMIKDLYPSIGYKYSDFVVPPQLYAPDQKVL